MKAMILAAGRGERLRPLTDHTPKPLVEVGGRPLIHYHLLALAQAGIRDLVINHAHLGERIEHSLGDGRDFGVRIRYSREQPAQETAGGVVQALPLLGPDPFLLINGDVLSDFNFSRLHLPAQRWARLVLVPNPPHHPRGDFALQTATANQGDLQTQGPHSYTFAGIGLYDPILFQNLKPGPAPLGPLLRQAMAQGRISGEVHHGLWIDVGTPERLAQANDLFQDCSRLRPA